MAWLDRDGGCDTGQSRPRAMGILREASDDDGSRERRPGEPRPPPLQPYRPCHGLPCSYLSHRMAAALTPGLDAVHVHGDSRRRHSGSVPRGVPVADSDMDSLPRRAARRHRLAGTIVSCTGPAFLPLLLELTGPGRHVCQPSALELRRGMRASLREMYILYGADRDIMSQLATATRALLGHARQAPSPAL